MFIMIAMLALGLMAGTLVYLVRFALATRQDTLFHPAENATIRRARRITGMTARSGDLVTAPARTS